MQETKRPYNPSRSVNPNHAPATNNFPNEEKLPGLTEEERDLLQNNGGCFKCQKFFAGHISRNCAAGPPLENLYRTLTANDVARAKATTKCATPVAHIAEATPVSNTATDLIAVLLPSSMITKGSGSDISNDSLSSVCSPTMKRKHLYWNCHINGTTADLSVKCRALQQQSTYQPDTL